MQKNDGGWTCRFGEFDIGDGYTLEVGHTFNFTILYVRLWRNENFIVGTTLHDFKNLPANLNGEINKRIKALPPSIHKACVSCAERVEKLKAFA